MLRDDAAMTLEHAILDVRPGEEPAFEAALDDALPLIAGAEGFRSLRLLRCVERAGRYLLLVEWESVAHHVEGFRGSPAFTEWRRLLHHFYDPPPTVEHFEAFRAEPA
jgi:heme-degrading monooxygenase HmoA